MRLNQLTKTLLFIYTPGMLFWMICFSVNTLPSRWSIADNPPSSYLLLLGIIIGWFVSYVYFAAIRVAIKEPHYKTALKIIIYGIASILTYLTLSFSNN